MDQNTQVAQKTRLLTLVIDKARNTSSVAGNSWMFYRNGEILSINNSMHGTDIEAFIEDSEEYGLGADLYMSSVPHRLFISSTRLQDIARRVGIRRIYYPALDPKLQERLCGNVNETEAIVPMKALNLRLSDLRTYQNLQHFYQAKRPWVIAITSGSFSGEDTQLHQFSEQYGAYQHLLEQCRTVHFVAEETGFCPVDIQNVRNRFGKQISTLKLKDVNQMDTALSTGFINNQTACAIVASLSMVRKLLINGKVDEIVYYVSLQEGVKSDTNTFGDFGDKWEVYDCQNLNNGIRVNLRKKGDYLFNSLN